MNLKEEINFSLWCDFIQRDFLDGEFVDLIDKKLIQGATTNLDVFQNVISISDAYQQQINMLQANDDKKIYEDLFCTDIKKAVQILKPLYDDNDENGFVSFDIDPRLYNDASGMHKEGIRLYDQIKSDNVMVKIPATPAGYSAMKSLTSLGISINATLIFSSQQAIESAKTLDAGIKISGKETKAVISVCASHFDSLFDEHKIGIINATKCYHEIQKFKNLHIRTLFISNEIDNLIFPDTINMASLEAIKDWNKNGIKEQSDIISENECDEYFTHLKENGIDIKNAYEILLKDELSAFRVSFDKLLNKVKL